MTIPKAFFSLLSKIKPYTIQPDLIEPIYYRLKPGNSKNEILNIIRRIVSSKYELITNERIVEIPFVFQNLGDKPMKLLEIGSTKSRLAIELASLGHQVAAVDLRGYEFSHPNLTFHKMDFLKNNFPVESFDAAVAVSTIEHIGLAAYGEKNFSDGDRRVLKEIYRILKKGGKLIITVPFGKRGQTSRWRVYNSHSLISMLQGFQVQKEEYYIGINRKYWQPCPKEDLGKIDSASLGFVQGVACIVASKE